VDWGQGVSERSERNGHLGQKLCADLCQHSGCAARRAVVREVWTGSEGEESEGKTNDWKWSGAVVARVCERESVEARAGSRYPGHQSWLGGCKS
jgi:hypothetical protein